VVAIDHLRRVLAHRFEMADEALGVEAPHRRRLERTIAADRVRLDLAIPAVEILEPDLVLERPLRRLERRVASASSSTTRSR
jgi:hypothetical protein